MKSPLTPESGGEISAEDRRLQALLRENGADYIDDAGFTDSVLGRLPPPRGTRPWRRFLLVAMASAAGVAAATTAGAWDRIENGAEIWRLLCAWSVRPLPCCGDALSFGSLLVLAASLAVGWLAYPRPD